MDQLSFKKICDYLDTKSVIHLSMTNRANYLLSLDEYMWKARSLIDFAFFFDYCPTIAEPEINAELPHLSDNVVQYLKDSFGKTKIHRLPDSYRESYKLIYDGRYSTIVNILNTELFTEMSFSIALITFDKKTKLFKTSWNVNLIQQYKYNMVHVINPDEMVDKWRIRKCPQELMGHPRQVYVEDIPLSSDSRPAFCIGDEVEVQWRRSQFDSWSWWRGFVINNYLVQGLQYPNPNGIEIPNVRYKDEIEGITVAFPHFAEESIWHTVTASIFAKEIINWDNPNFGYVGGVRKVKCHSESRMWNTEYCRFLSIRGDLETRAHQLLQEQHMALEAQGFEFDGMDEVDEMDDVDEVDEVDGDEMEEGE